jgi:hypothetical protein
MYSTRKPYSRLEKIEEQNSKRTALTYIILTLGVIVFVGVFGIAVFSGLAELINGSKSYQSQSTDNTPPPPPILSTAPQETNNQKIMITGSTESQAIVTLNVNNKKYEGVADDKGQFAIEVNLDKGSNFIYATAVDNSGNISIQSNNITVILNTEKPKLEITKPKDGDKFYGPKQQQITIEGTTDSNSTLTVNDHIVILDPSGAFRYTTIIPEGDTLFTIKSTNKAGNTTESTLTVTFVP